MVTFTLSEPLARLFDRLCGQNCPKNEAGLCSAGAHCKQEVIQEIVQSARGPSGLRRLRTNLEDSECEACNLWLVLQAIDRFNAHNVEAWLERPHVDLAGRTPVACLAAGDYEDIVNALWLQPSEHGFGPVS